LSEVALGLARCLELYFVSMHGCWLSIVEVELCVVVVLCLDRCIFDVGGLVSQISAWGFARNNDLKVVDWQFSTVDARIKLKHLYPKI